MVMDHQGKSHGSAFFADIVREGALFSSSPRMGLLDLVMTLSGTLPPRAFKKREAQYVYDITVVIRMIANPVWKKPHVLAVVNSPNRNNQLTT